MDAYFKNRCVRFVVCCSKEPVIAYLKYQSVAVLLIGSLLVPGLACADVLSDFYVKFTQTAGEILFQPITDSAGSELKSINVEYHNQPVSFQYQRWRLRPNSVCQSLKADLLSYSVCTEAASQFFRETCQTLQQPSHSPNYPNYKRLYCNAAASYQPVIAKISRSAAVDEKAEQRQQCSILTLKAARTRKNIDIYNRDKACGEGG